VSLRVYLAGKVEAGDWRHSLVPLRGAGPQYEFGDKPWLGHEIEFKAGLRRMTYTGPFFYSCDHGCFHSDGISTHGVGAGNENVEGAYDGMTRRYLLGQCEAAIRRADVVFAWLDNPTAYGTIAEIGYARALGKHLVIARPPEGQDLHELWMAFQMADKVLYHFDPVAAFHRYFDE
jgi:hypothetical protein